MYHSAVSKPSQRQTYYNLFSASLVILLYDHPDCFNTPFPNFCYLCFFSTPSLIFPPFLSLLAFAINGAYFRSPSIASEGILFLLLSQNDQSHPIFGKLQCLLILITDFSALQFFYIHYSRKLKVPMFEGQGRAVPISQNIILWLLFSLYTPFSIFT